MVDVLTPDQRRYNMSRIGSKNTLPERLLRRGLFAIGVRFRLHRRDLPGTPDLIFPKRRVCMFCHGCFWHGHDCGLYRLPATRTDFWRDKIASNQRRDAKSRQELLECGWRVLVVWECVTRGSRRKHFNEV